MNSMAIIQLQVSITVHYGNTYVVNKTNFFHLSSVPGTLRDDTANTK